MDNAQQILKKYKSRVNAATILIFIIYFVSMYLFAWLMPTWGLFLYTAVYILAMRLTINHFWRKYISGVLKNDLDAPLYREIIIAGRIGEKNPLFTMESEFFVGNVTAAFEIGNAALKNKAFAKKNAPLTLLLFAEYNYLIGDDEGVALACRRFRELKLPKFKSKRLKLTLRGIEKYEQYLAGDIEAILRPTGKKRNDALYHLIHSYFGARVALCRGDKEGARAAFSGIAVASQTGVIGMMSKFAVDAIDSGRDFAQSSALLPNEPIDSDPLIQSYEENSKKLKKRVVLFAIIAALSLLSTLPDAISEWQWRNEERITRSLVKEQYGKVDVLDWFGLDDEVIFIAESEEGLILGGRHLDENGEWTANVYGYCPFVGIENGESYGEAFIRYNGEQFYYLFYGNIAGVYYEGQVYQTAIWTDGLGFVFIVINDEPIELIE